jgi:hypothetical protein
MVGIVNGSSELFLLNLNVDHDQIPNSDIGILVKYIIQGEYLKVIDHFKKLGFFSLSTETDFLSFLSRKHDQPELFYLGIACLYCFIQNYWTGPNFKDFSLKDLFSEKVYIFLLVKSRDLMICL